MYILGMLPSKQEYPIFPAVFSSSRVIRSDNFESSFAAIYENTHTTCNAIKNIPSAFFILIRWGYLVINSISQLSCNFITTLPNAGDFPFLPKPLSKFIRPLGINSFPPTTEL